MDEQSAVLLTSSISFYVSSLYRKDNPCLGDILVRLSPFLKLYTDYIGNFDKAIKSLNTWMAKVPKFASLLQDIQVSSMLQNNNVGWNYDKAIKSLNTWMAKVPKFASLLQDIQVRSMLQNNNVGWNCKSGST